MTISLQRISAITLAVSASLALSACGGSEPKFFSGLSGTTSTSTVGGGNTGNNANNNTSNNAGTSTGTNTGTGTDSTGNNVPTAPSTNGTSTGTSQNRPITNQTDTHTAVSALTNGNIRAEPTIVVKAEPLDFYASKARNSAIQAMITAYDQKDAYGNSRFETVEAYQGTINGTTKRRNVKFASPELGQEYQDYTLTETAKTNIDGKTYSADRTARVQLYQGQHSMVIGTQTLSGQVSDGSTTKSLTEGELLIDHLKGNPTLHEEVNELASRNSATFTYNGRAFSQAGAGNFTYTIDFVDQSGSGKITGLSDKGTINLNQGSIGKFTHSNYDSVEPLAGIGIRGLAHFENGSKDGVYMLGFFGPEVAEVAGFVSEDGNKHTVGFGGKR